MAIPKAKPFATVEEYLRTETVAEQKHEYIDGQIIAMSGGTYRASYIQSNLVHLLKRDLRGSPCVPHGSDLRIRIPGTPFLTYPDLSVICGIPGFDPADPGRTTVTNPRLIIEVLSPSTELYDRGEKFARYRRLDSLDEYVLVSQDKPRIETFLRDRGGKWMLSEFDGEKAVATLKSIKLKLKLAEVYEGVDEAE